MYPVKNGSTPKYIMDLFQVNCDRDRRYNLRNSDFRLPHCNTVTNEKHTIRYLGPSLWAKLTKKERTIKSLLTFRTNMQKEHISCCMLERL